MSKFSCSLSHPNVSRWLSLQSPAEDLVRISGWRLHEGEGKVPNSKAVGQGLYRGTHTPCVDTQKAARELCDMVRESFAWSESPPTLGNSTKHLQFMLEEVF